MKLLLDENLSYKMVEQIKDLYPESCHVRDFNLLEANDEDIWKFAAQKEFVILSKDADFHQRSLLRGYPPKFIYLRFGNCSTQQIVDILRKEHQAIEEFYRDALETMLVIM